MKRVTILILCLFLISISMVAFAEQPAQTGLQGEDMEGQVTKEVKKLPSTMIADEEDRAIDEADEDEWSYTDDNYTDFE